MGINIFEYATRNRLRFATSRGLMSVEELWEIPLRSKDEFNLDVVAKTANKALKEISEESFVETKRTPDHTKRRVALDVIKYVIDTKLADEVARERHAQNKIKKERLLAVLAKKQDEKLDSLSMKDLQRQISELDEEIDEEV